MSEVLTLGELAGLLKISIGTARKLIQTNKISRLPTTGAVRVSRYAVENYLKGNTQSEQEVTG